MGGYRLPIGGQRSVHKKERLRQPCPSQKAKGARYARRDPAQILLSAQVPFNGDPVETAAAAAALGAAGAGLAIIYLRPPYTPSVLEPLARALSAS